MLTEQGSEFRQYILEHVRQMRRPLNRDSAKYYGQLQAEIKEKITSDVRNTFSVAEPRDERSNIFTNTVDSLQLPDSIMEGIFHLWNV